MISLSKEQVRLEALKLALTVMQHSSSNLQDARELVNTAQTIESYILGAQSAVNTGSGGNAETIPINTPTIPPIERNSEP